MQSESEKPETPAPPTKPRRLNRDPFAKPTGAAVQYRDGTVYREFSDVSLRRRDPKPLSKKQRNKLKRDARKKAA